ncbi:hypothetical protein EVJ58_g3187 [Rhodofomes roseus]|uniref:Uncharacterized protein n=1 Tax=Rhodofomes roseus TaxID=34475 RepID=A0A4Y9YP95_9APHY|nr:hypothetical protein EVJ58_g3187 [Rhodofomes roseus]
MRTRHYRGFFDLFGRDGALSKACCMSPKVPELPQRQANRQCALTYLGNEPCGRGNITDNLEQFYP